MKATQRDFGRIAEKAAASARVFFFCGPDEAGAWSAAEQIAALLDNPGERVELAGADLRKDPVILSDEARSTSLFGETRHILVRAQGDEVHDAVSNLLLDDVETSPVLIVAMGATDKSRTAKLLTGRPDALVAMFYPPDLAAVGTAVRQMADSIGLNIDSGLAQRIAAGAGLDVRLARSEVEKLALYLDASPATPKTADLDALEAVGARSDDESYANLVDAVLSGDIQRLPRELKRFGDLAIGPVPVLLAIERRAAQLAALSAKLGPRGDISALLESEKAARRVFWKDVPQLQIQLARWRGKRLARLVDKLARLHVRMLENSQDAPLHLAQSMTEIARAASR